MPVSDPNHIINSRILEIRAQLAQARRQKNAELMKALTDHIFTLHTLAAVLTLCEPLYNGNTEIEEDVALAIELLEEDNDNV